MLAVFRSPILHSVSPYDHPYLSYMPFWEKYTEWPKMTLNTTSSVKATLSEQLLPAASWSPGVSYPWWRWAQWVAWWRCLQRQGVQSLGRTVGRVVKALDTQPRHRGFESRSTLSLQYLESLDKILPEMCSDSLSRKMRTWQYTACTDKSIVHWSSVESCSVHPGCMLRSGVEKVLVCTGVPGVIICKALRDLEI